ncbi:MAG: hypothetical protein H7A24_00675 [Leptospiraceae bacterium]|nr:hypothetical protein [Leptospiraceae bacterium]MCP5510367.1 hypothetical protein [Leptospiraceae bacterium]
MQFSNETTTNSQSVQNLIYYMVIGFIGVLITVLYNNGFSNYILGWIAFSIAAYSVAGNDAIQTIGTFIESKKESKLLPKILIFCGLLFLVSLYGWFVDDGEIHFHRLDKFPSPDKYNLIQLLAPLVLVVITRMKAPISTTFLILGLFGGRNIDKMLTKSFLGYGIAFLSALLIWGLHSYFKKEEYEENIENKASDEFWGKLQWASTSLLWVSWLLQDTANIAVYLPRKLSIFEAIMALSIIAGALSFILYTNGGAIQEIVSEKSDINSAKAATILDIVYAAVLIVFQQISKMPMSTTWVFLGLLAGREIIIHMVTKRDRPYLETFRQVGKDVMLASLGITISISFFILSTYIYSGELLGLDTILNLSKYLSIAQ